MGLSVALALAENGFHRGQKPFATDKKSNFSIQLGIQRDFWSPYSQWMLPKAA